MPENSRAPLPPPEQAAEAETGTPADLEPDSNQFATDVEGEPSFACDCEEEARSACKDEPLYKEHEGRRYCVLHYPGKEKSAAFKEAIQRKLDHEDFDFSRVWFPGKTSFNGLRFGAVADFSYATFAGPASFNHATFDAKANFEHATFNKAASFSNAVFNHGVSFYSAYFSEEAYFTFNSTAVNEKADFRTVTFDAWTEINSATFNGEVDFHQSTFRNQASFNSTTFGGEVCFGSAKFKGGIEFNGTVFSSQADFEYATLRGETNFPNATFGAVVSFNHASFGAAAWFTSVTFSAEALFFSATFDGETRFSASMFSGLAEFTSAQFNYVDFTQAKFQGPARFILTRFGARASFKDAQFSELTLFNSCQFSSEGDFSYSKFAGDIAFVSATIDGRLDFSYANFADGLTFSAANEKEGFSDQSSLDLQHARIDKPDRMSFHTVSLRPHWFINVDCRKFDLTNVSWRGLFAKGKAIDDEIKFAARRGASTALDSGTLPAHRLLPIACWRLAVNAEENHRYDEASKLRFWAMDAQRKGRAHGFAVWEFAWWYGVASGYGELTARACLWLVIIWLLFVPVYWQADFMRNETKITARESVYRVESVDTIQHLPLRRALTYSLEVMTLQRPEPRPATNRVRLAVLAETFLGPVQAALLALAIRRKFMR